MASLATLVSVTENLLVALKTDFFRRMCPPLQLEGFLSAVTDFRKFLVDTEAAAAADGKRIIEARCAIYEADDLVDELLTRGYLERRGGQLFFPHKTKWMKQFKPVLERTVNILRFYMHSFTPLLVPMIENSSSSYDHNDSIVGREDEVQALLQKLLSSSSDVHAIVGLGGIGKTALARHLFIHPVIQTVFPLRIWVCVSNIHKPFDAKHVLSHIMEDLFRQRFSHDDLPIHEMGIHEMGIRLQEIIRENKYLLVLDAMWNVDPQDWLGFKAVLPKGGEGSRILVTTRSIETARIVGDLKPYELKGLSQPDSWRLFQSIAFYRNDNIDNHYDKVVELAKQIVPMCCSIPLAIRAVARMLYGQDISKWHFFQKCGLAKIIEETGMLAILKLSYYNLGFTLKNCFVYCALFPLETVMHKTMLISLWMAQGYIVSSKDQSIEDVGGECFSGLLGKGFFEVVETDEWGEIVSCKMHRLMHIMAKLVAGEEFWEDNSASKLIRNSAYHLFHSRESSVLNYFFTEPKIRSYLRNACSQLSVDVLVKQWRSLRTLDLHCLDIKTLPDSIGGLLHLRYLDLSHNKYLETLPNSIVKLGNLQTLDSRFCAMLKELPRQLSRLSTLRRLDMFGCDGLTQMPPGMEKLTSLQHLSLFVVAEGISSAEIRDLKKLVNLRGRICISIPRSYTHVKRIDWRGGCLEAHEHLQEVWVRFLESHSVDNSDQRVANYHQIVLEKLQPHGNTMKFVLWGYQGATIAKWGSAENNWADTLSSLVKIELRSCEKMKQLPRLSDLPRLKSLKLHGLRELEYLEIAANSSSTQVARAFFPSLQELEIINAPKLRGLWDGNTIPNLSTFPPSLVRIEFRSCEKLQQLPLLSNLSLLKSLKLYGLSNLENLWEMLQPDTTFFPSLEELEIVDALKLRGCMASLEAPCFKSLKSLVLANLPELEEFYYLEGGYNGQQRKSDDHISTLQFGCLSELRVSNCPKLMSMPLVPTLEVLEAINIHVHLLKHIVGTQGFQASSSTSSTLRQVDIVAVHELLNLPPCLSNVEFLTIRQCELLEQLDFGSSAHVKRLTIQECGKLKHIFPELNHLSCLEELEIKDCEDLDWSIKDDGGSGIAWQNLKTLRLTNISKCESLKEGLGCLTTLEKLSLSWLYDLRALPDEIHLLDHLRHLIIRCCQNLTVFPESLGRLSSLEKLEIESCSRLKHLPDSLPRESLQVLIRNCPQLSSSS